jgi:hypothetical protein
MRYFETGNIVRNLYGQSLLENFLVSGIFSILIIRVYLEFTGYPQVGGTHFHIAHMLYGGIMMLTALFITFAFLNRTAIGFASVVGGIGFGFFIDELGKFITRDNNYFFQPTFAIIYVIFVLLYLASEALPKVKQISPKEYLVNALDLMKEIVIQDLDKDEKKLMLTYLAESDRNDPLVAELRAIVKAYKSKPVTDNPITLLKGHMLHFVHFLTSSTLFYRFMIIVLSISSVFYILFSLLIAAALNKSLFISAGVLLTGVLLFLSARLKSIYYLLLVVLTIFVLLGINMLSYQPMKLDISFIQTAGLLSSLTSGIIALIGILQLKHSRERGLAYIRISLLCAIFLTQFFQFYSQQLFAIAGLSFDILMLITVETVLKSMQLQGGQAESKGA